MNTPRRDWRSGFPMISGRGAGAGCWALRSTPCTCRWTPTRWLRGRSAINEIQNRADQLECKPAHRRIIGSATRLSRSKPAGQLMSAEAYRPVVVAYRDGSPVRLEELGTIHRQRPRMTRRHPGSTRTTAAAAPSFWPSSAAGDQHHRSDRRRQITASVVPRRNCRPRSTWDVLVRPVRYDSRAFNDVKFTIDPDTRTGSRSDFFLFLRNIPPPSFPAWRCPSPSSGTSRSCTF